jgi:hypothetical protein
MASIYNLLLKIFGSNKTWILLIAVLVLGLVYTVLSRFNLPWQQSTAWKAMPENFGIVFELGSFSERQDQFKTGELGTLPAMNIVTEDYQLIDSIIAKFPELAALNDASLLSGLGISRVDALAALHIFELKKGQLSTAQLSSIFERELLSTASFRGQSLLNLKFSNGQKITIAKYKNLLLLSRLSLFVEYAIDAVSDKQGLSPNHAIVLPSSKQNANIHIKGSLLATFTEVFSPFARKDVASLNKMFDWTSLKLSGDSSALMLQGRLNAADGNALFQALVRQDLAPASHIDEVLPDNIAILHYIGADGLKSLCSKLSSSKHKAFKKHILPWVKHDMGLFITDPADEKYLKDAYALVQCTDTSKALKLLRAYQADVKEPTNFHLDYRIDRLSANDVFETVFGPSLSLINAPYYTAIDDYIVFANSLDGLKLWIDKHNFGLVLHNDQRYQTLLARLPERAHYRFLAFPSRCIQLVKAYTRPELRDPVLKAFEACQNFEPFSINCVGQGRRFDLSVVGIPDTVKTKQTASIAWRVELLAKAHLAPNLVVNHQSGKQEIIIQDSTKRLYLIGNDGVLRWSKVIDDLILSDIYQVDYFDNGYLQYVFNTKSKIYMLDYLGNEVYEPISIPVGAAKGMLVTNLGLGHRFFVGSLNANVFGYKSDGSPLEGWSPQTLPSPLATPMKVYKDGANYKLAAINQGGNLYNYNRSGAQAGPLVNVGTDIVNWGIDAEHKRIAVCQSSGSVVAANYQGATFRLAVSPEGQKLSGFEFQDIVNDERYDYLSLSSKLLNLYAYTDKEFKKVFSVKTPEPMDILCAFDIVGSAKKGIGTVSRKARKLWLWSSKGKLLPGFPLAGSSRFVVSDLFQESINILVVADQKVVYAYKLPKLWD